MKKVTVEELTLEAFAPFGHYSNLINPDKEKIGDKPAEFFRDMVLLNTGAPVNAFSVCRVEPRQFIVDVTEIHTNTEEGILPLDNDVLIHVGPATAGEFPADKIRIFKVPKGTMVTLHKGVWHHAPFTVNEEAVNVLIVLPERTYANDCDVLELKDDQKIAIEF